MMTFSSYLLLLLLVIGCLMASCSGNFYQDVDITWGDGRGKILTNGQFLTLSLDNASGSGFESRNEFLYGKFDIQLKLIPGNSAGTITTFYASSTGYARDEVDFEFLGNSSGDPYILHTNIFLRGQGSREQEFFLWFDPIVDFHTYSILWNPQSIILSIDDIPIRELKNMVSKGGSFPNQPTKIYGSLWNNDGWATRGGLLKIDWSQAPFTATYANFNATNACVWSNGTTSCSSTSPSSGSYDNAWFSQQLNSTDQERMNWVKKNYMIYDYCTDTQRFPQGLPLECNSS